MITTPDLILRPLTVADASAVFAYASHTKVTQFTQWSAHTSFQDTVQFIQHAQNIWGLEHRATGKLIGECGFIPRDTTTVEIHCTLAYQWWGHGFATQALTELITVCFNNLNYQHIQAWTISDNLPSQRLVKKLGMSHCAKAPHQWLANDGALYTIDLYTLNRNEWFTSKNQHQQGTAYHSYLSAQNTQSL